MGLGGVAAARVSPGSLSPPVVTTRAQLHVPCTQLHVRYVALLLHCLTNG